MRSGKRAHDALVLFCRSPRRLPSQTKEMDRTHLEDADGAAQRAVHSEAEAGVEETRVVRAKLAHQVGEGCHLRRKPRRHCDALFGAEDVEAVLDEGEAAEGLRRLVDDHGAEERRRVVAVH